MRANRLVARNYLRRAAVLWVGARLLVSAVVGLAGGDPLHLGAPAALVVIAATATLACVQTLRLRERVLLGNLGISVGALSLYFAAPPLFGEWALATAWQAFR